jgi:hypothetical protein
MTAVVRSIAGGLATPVKHGPTLPPNALPFCLFVLTANPEKPELYLSNASGEWAAVVTVHQL